MTFVPFLISQRESGQWEDCTWTSGVMLGNFMCGRNRYPPTRAEYESLRAASGEPRELEGDGSSIMPNLYDGMTARYGMVGIVLDSWTEVEREFVRVPGTAVAIQGMNAKLGAARITSFAGAHCILVVNDDGVLRALNPLAIEGSAPITISAATLRAYFTALPGARAMLGYEREQERRNPMLRFSLERWSIAAGTNVYEFPDGPRISTYSVPKQITTIGLPMDRVKDSTPFLTGGWRAVLVSTSAIDGEKRQKIGFVRREDLTPVPTGSAWDAAVLAALADPSFSQSPPPVVTIPDPEALLAAQGEGFIKGRDAAAAAAAAVQPR